MKKFFSKRNAQLTLRKLTIGLVSLAAGGVLFYHGGVPFEVFSSEQIVYAAEIEGSAATLSPDRATSVNIKTTDTFDPYTLLSVQEGYQAKFTYITLRGSRLGTKYFMTYEDLKNSGLTGTADFTFEINNSDGSPHMKSDGQRDIVHAYVTVTADTPKPLNDTYEPSGGEFSVEEHKKLPKTGTTENEETIGILFGLGILLSSIRVFLNKKRQDEDVD